MRSRAPAGLRLARPRRWSHVVIAASAFGATVERSKSSPQARLERGGVARALLARRRPRVVVVRVAALRVAAVEDERPRPARVRRREEDAQRPALRVAEQRRRLGAGGVHHGADVVHARVEVGQADGAVGEPGPALVEADQPRERAEPLEDPRAPRMLPVDLEVREEPGHEDEVERPVARDLVRDADVAAPRVADRRRAAVRDAHRANVVPRGRRTHGRRPGSS